MSRSLTNRPDRSLLPTFKPKSRRSSLKRPRDRLKFNFSCKPELRPKLMRPLPCLPNRKPRRKRKRPKNLPPKRRQRASNKPRLPSLRSSKRPLTKRRGRSLPRRLLRSQRNWPRSKLKVLLNRKRLRSPLS